MVEKAPATGLLWRIARRLLREPLFVLGVLLFVFGAIVAPPPRLVVGTEEQTTPIVIYRTGAGLGVHFPFEPVDQRPVDAQPLAQYMFLGSTREVSRFGLVETLGIAPDLGLSEKEQGTLLILMAAAFDRCRACAAFNPLAAELARAGVWERREFYWGAVIRDASTILTLLGVAIAIAKHRRERRARLDADLAERGGPCARCGYSGVGLAGTPCPACGNHSPRGGG